MSFIEVDLAKWDFNRVRIGTNKKNPTPTILYDDKIPIIRICSDNPKNKYLLFSFYGLQKNMVFDQSTKKFTDIWDGDWSISYTVTPTYEKAEDENGLTWKIILIFKDIEDKIKQAFEKDPNPALQMSYIKEKNQFGVEKVTGIDKSKPVYLKAKVGYDAPKNAPTMTNKQNKQVPVPESRYPKAKFYDVTRAQDDIEVKDADKECSISMDAIPKIMLGLATVNGVIYVTKRLMQNYYRPVSIGGNTQDQDLIDELRDLNLNCDQ